MNSTPSITAIVDLFETRVLNDSGSPEFEAKNCLIQTIQNELI